MSSEKKVQDNAVNVRTFAEDRLHLSKIFKQA